MGLKNEVNGGKLISSGVTMIIYDKYWTYIQFQSILDLTAKNMKRFDFEVNSQHLPRLQSTVSKEPLEPLHQNGRGRAKVQLRGKF